MKTLMIASFILGSFVSFALPDQHRQCNFACKSIPPEESALTQITTTTADQLPNENFHVVIWNIYKAKKANFSEKFNQILHKSHLILLQEYIDDDEMTQFINQNSNMEFYHAESFWLKDQIPTGVATGSYATALFVKNQQTKAVEPWVNSPKSNLITVYQTTKNKKLMVINIHGLNRTSETDLEDQLKRTSTYIEHHIGPIIFAGDFNSRNNNRKKVVENFFKGFNFKLVEFANDPRTSRKRIDHIFYRGLNILNSKIEMDTEASDHPILSMDASIAD